MKLELQLKREMKGLLIHDISQLQKVLSQS